jgi:hypothetical protein
MEHLRTGVGCVQPLAYRTLFALEFRELEQEHSDVTAVRERLRFSLAADVSQDLSRNQLRRRDHVDVVYSLQRRKYVYWTYVDQVTVSILPHLVYTVANATSHLAYAHGDMEALRQVSSQLFGQSRSGDAGDIYILRRSPLTDVGVNCLSTEYHYVVAPAQEVEDGILNYGQWQRITHDELPQRQSAVPKKWGRGFDR